MIIHGNVRDSDICPDYYVQYLIERCAFDNPIKTRFIGNLLLAKLASTLLQCLATV